MNFSKKSLADIELLKELQEIFLKKFRKKFKKESISAGVLGDFFINLPFISC